MLLKSPSDKPLINSRFNRTINQKEKELQKLVFDFYVDIENNQMAAESRQVDLAEALYFYSKN